MGLPNQISFLRILLTPVFVFLFFNNRPSAIYWSLIVFTIAAATDWYDGYLARKFGNVSKFGKFLDPLADKILVLTGFITFNFIGYIPLWIILVFIVRDLLVTGLRVYGIYIDNPVKTNFFGKIKTFGQFIVLYYIFLYHLLIQVKGVDDQFKLLGFIFQSKGILILLYLITIVTLLSAIVYLIENRSHLRKIAADIW